MTVLLLNVYFWYILIIANQYQKWALIKIYIFKKKFTLFYAVTPMIEATAIVKAAIDMAYGPILSYFMKLFPI